MTDRRRWSRSADDAARSSAASRACARRRCASARSSPTPTSRRTSLAPGGARRRMTSRSSNDGARRAPRRASAPSATSPSRSPASAATQPTLVLDRTTCGFAPSVARPKATAAASSPCGQRRSRGRRRRGNVRARRCRARDRLRRGRGADLLRFSAAPIYLLSRRTRWRAVHLSGRRWRVPDAPGHFIAWLRARQPVDGWRMPGPRLDVGNPRRSRRRRAAHCRGPARYGSPPRRLPRSPRLRLAFRRLRVVARRTTSQTASGRRADRRGPCD